MNILLVDNFDSFTYNLFQQLLIVGEAHDCQVSVVRNNHPDVKSLLNKSWDALVISPGPGGPEDTGICQELMLSFLGNIPILGVCLGHQFLGSYFGALVKKAKQPIHGKPWTVFHNHSLLFCDLPSPISVARYHSLIVCNDSLPSCISVDAHTSDNEIMAFSIHEKLVWGVQFHPESFLTPLGDKITENFLTIVAGHKSRTSKLIARSQISQVCAEITN